MTTLSPFKTMITPPSLDDLDSFEAKNEVFFGQQLPAFQTEMNVIISEINENLPAIESAAANASIAAAPAYDSEATYNYPDIVAGRDGYTYRCKGTNVIDDDPVGSVTGNWVSLTPGVSALFNSISSKSSDYSITVNDKGKMIEATAGTWTLNLDTLGPSGAGMGFTIVVKNSGSGEITVGTSGESLLPGESCFISSNGSAWKVIMLAQAALSKNERYFTGVTDNANYSCISAACTVWQPYKSLPVAKMRAMGAPLPDGRFLVVGGYTTTTTVDTTDIFDPTTNTWSSKLAMPTAKQWACCAPLMDGTVFITCGSGDSSYYTSSHLYDPVANTWASKAAFPSAAKNMAACATLLDGRVLVVGGTTNNGVCTNECHIYDPAANTWTSRASHPGTAKRLSVAITMLDGRVLVMGGYTTACVDTCYIYDPTANMWSAPTAPMPTAKLGFAAGLLLDGRVLVVGGWNGSIGLSEAYIYDPNADVWLSRPALPLAAYHIFGGMLADGRMIVAGGYNGQWLSSCNILEVVNTWKRSA